MSPHSVRSYQSGDEATLVAIANRTYAPYGGHVPRTVERWRWSILDRPGIEPADVRLLVIGTDEIAGYGVLGADGMVLEFCVDPDLKGDAREEVAQSLIAALEERCRERGLETIIFELPRVDGRVHNALVAEGYRDEEIQSLQLILVDVAEAMRRILDHRRGRFPHGWGPTFFFELAPGLYRTHAITGIRVKLGDELAVEENPSPDVERDITVGICLSTLTDIILKRDNFDQALADGRVTVRPAEAQQDARTLFDWLGIRAPWYTPPADGR